MTNGKDKKVKNSKSRFGIILAILQSIFTLVFIGLMMVLNIIPFKYMMPVGIILMVLSVITFFTQISRKGFKIGKISSILFCILLLISSIYLFKMQSMFSEITGVATKIDELVVIVLKEDVAKSIQDAAGYTVGIQEIIDRENTDKIIQTIKEDLGTEIKTVLYPDFDSQVEALYQGEVKAIVINQAYREMITDIYEDFYKKTRVLAENHVETEVKLKESNKKVRKDPFTVYISGIDTYGSISTTSRSDVNIIATVNPNTKQILLTTTPRDYYVPFPISDGICDKLTHAGIYGVDISIGTLEELYDISIDYYLRINFTSFIEMVDALGGVTVDSQYTFQVGSYNFTQGENQLNGEAALAFARERHAFARGDNQRGENQMEIIKAMLNKVSSPTIIKNAGSIMDSITNSLETNMSQTEITNLIKMQMNDGGEWEILFNSVKGTDDRRTTYSYRRRENYVMIPDQETVETAKIKMQEVMESEDKK